MILPSAMRKERATKSFGEIEFGNAQLGDARRTKRLVKSAKQSLQPAIAIISVTALTLLNLRDASRKPDAKTRPTTELISRDYIKVLSAWRHGRVRDDWSVYDFCYALARLGGHQNRKSDSHPGWIVLWRGWQELGAMMLGADVINDLKKCG